MNPVLDALLTDLATEGAVLDAVVSGLDEEGWRTPTPAAGWDVATQIAHLAWTDEVAVTAATDKPGWDALVLEAIDDPEGFVDRCALAGGAVSPEALLTRWRTSRSGLVETLQAVPEGVKLPWFGPPMSPTSMATARYMETWAHSLDVHEALGLAYDVTDRIRHVAHLGVRTRGFSFVTRGQEVPPADVLVTLTAPSGETWTFGSQDAPETVTGSAYDFCRLVTQRVHRDDTDLVAHGDGASAWLDIAQAFAGPPGAGRAAS